MFLLLMACSGQLEITTAEELREACESGDPVDTELSVTFEALNGGCPFGEDDNLPAEQAVFTARIEQTEALTLPEGGVLCGLEFDFEGIDPSFEQEITYDDNFMLNFNDVVLAASYGPMVDMLPEDGDLRTYDWETLAGTELSFDSVPTYCLGDAGGDSSCTVPEPEQPGVIAMQFGGDLVDQLALRALEEDRFEFSFVSMGDNDDSDCSHSEFTFSVTAPVVEL